jgi:carbon storage regulator CsrA
MLCISRKSGQRVKVGDCWIRVAISNGQVRMAFDAPPHIKITREELLNESDKQDRKIREASTVRRG